MFSFFGLFCDPSSDLQDQIYKIWPSQTIAPIDDPLSLIGLRFEKNVYEPSLEDIPKVVDLAVHNLSMLNSTVRFLLLRTECFGGTCENWGHIIQNGKIIYEASGEEAL